jgi:hypothetical protein
MWATMDDERCLTVAANASLDAIDVALLRAVTARTGGRLDCRAQRRLINDHLIPLLRESGRPRWPPRLPVSYRQLMSEAAARGVAAIEAAGCHMHGDLDELLPGGETFGDEQETSRVSQTDVLNAAIEALVMSARSRAPQ